MFLKSNNLGKFPELIHGFTTRELGVDYPRIAQELGLSESAFFTLKQVHSNQVLVLSPSPQPSPLKGEGVRKIPPPLRGGGEWEGGRPEGDAIVTQKPGVLIGIRTADCVPILVYDPEQRAVGAIHAGWRGLIAGIIENSIGTMREKFLTNPKNLAVVVGAALCPGCFEIGPEVAEAFRKRFGDRLEPVSDPSKAESVTGSCARRALTITAGRGDRSFVDLRKGCELALADSGLSEKNLEFLPYCTACHRELFYSHRKGDTDKRQMAFIGVKSNF